MKVEVKLTPSEFRKLLGDSKMGEMYDELVKILEEYGLSHEEAGGYVAKIFLESFRKG